MENAIVDWKNEDEKKPEDYDSDVVSWVLKKGLRLGKVMLVTGILISSAPVVLPPLAVISAFGIAISVPYGVFLASYACSEKLMAFLLPKAAPPLMEEHRAIYEEEEDRNGEKDQEEIKQVEPFGNGGERGLRMIGDENEIEETPRGDVLELQIKPTEEEKEEKQREETSEMETESIKEEEREKQSISEDPVLKNDGSAEKTSEIEVIPIGFQEKKEQATAKDIEIQQKPEKDTEMGPKINETSQETEQKTNENKTNQDKKPHRKAKKPLKGSKQSTQNGSGTSPAEEVYSEKKIWEEINALRTIMGYKAPRLPSSMEELKALYRFTGVEPPASIKDPSDLAEVTHKLRSLMAIVGVN